MIKKTVLTITIIILLGVTFSGCISDDKTENNTEKENALGNLDYTNTEYGFGLNPPQGWIIDENDAYGVVRFYAPEVNEININLGISESSYLESGQTLESFVEEIKEYYLTEIPGFEFISSEPRTFNNMNAYDLKYTFALDLIPLKQTQYIIEKNDIVYISTYTANNETYDTYLTIVEQSIDTFTII